MFKTGKRHFKTIPAHKKRFHRNYKQLRINLRLKDTKHLSKHYKELLQKTQNPTRKQLNGSKFFWETLIH